MLNELSIILSKDANKTIERYHKIDERLIVDALNTFNQTQFHYSQSF